MQDLSGSNRLPQTVAMFWQSAEMQGAEARLGLTWEPGRETWKAPMCCVMPPASPAATDVLRRASSRDVWQPQTCVTLSTCTGGLFHWQCSADSTCFAG